MSDRRRIADDELFVHFVTFSCHKRDLARLRRPSSKAIAATRGETHSTCPQTDVWGSP